MPWAIACQAPLFFTISQSLLTFMSIELVMSSNHLILCRSLLLLPSILLSITVFSNESILCIRCRNIWSLSFSISSSSDYSWLISLRLTELIFFQSKGLSRDFSNTTVQKHQFIGAQPSFWSDSHINA